MENDTELSKPVRDLECNCCGGSTRGRQWWNRDTGYGMCVACIAYVRSHGTTEEEIRNLYGIEGIHWGIQSIELRQELADALTEAR